jgi:putative LysE/RhtB family amino acid efflux pump
MEALLSGVVIGLSIAVPPGPNAALCMGQTLAGGRSAGLRAGFGAATAHAVYATAAVVGLGQASELLARDGGTVRLMAGLALLGLGVRMELTRTRRRLPSTRAFAVTLALGVANPLTLLYFTAVVAIGAMPTGAATLVIFGVFAGSALWWVILVCSVDALGRRLGDQGLARANRVVAAGLAVFGGIAIASVLA